MAEDKVRQAIGYFEEELLRGGLRVSKIILFGSQAQDNATAESDIDLVVISDDFTDKSIFDRAVLLKEADVKTIKKFMVPLDVIMMTAEELGRETSIISQYVEKGKVVYAA